MLKRYSILCTAAALAAFALSGCVAPKKVITDYDQRIAKVKAIGILAPDIEYYELSAGGIREKNDTWSEQANRNVVDALTTELTNKGFEVKVIAREGALKQSMDEILGLFSSIAWSYQQHVVAVRYVDLFPHKVEFFDYSVGPVDEILDAYHVNALCLVDGIGQGNSFFLRGSTVILIGLVDRTGALLWYEPYAMPEAHTTTDIRDADEVKKRIKKMIAKMPEVPK
jgi:hypothetical protein